MSSVILKETKKEKQTFSISLSLPLLVPRPGTDNCRSSLPRAELRSEPPRLFEVGFAFLWRKADSASRRRVVASSLFSSVNFRRRSVETQSSHLLAHLVSSGSCALPGVMAIFLSRFHELGERNGTMPKEEAQMWSSKSCKISKAPDRHWSWSDKHVVNGRMMNESIGGSNNTYVLFQPL